MCKSIKIHVILYVTIIITSNSTSQVEGSDGELLAVSLLFRHGDRTPEGFYPNDPYQNSSFWPVAPGELTNAGKQRHYNLGIWLRQRYNDFLLSKYSPADIYVRSGDMNRCLESAATDLSGLYPPEGDQVWDATLPWQPIPIHTVASQSDGLIELEKPCPKWDLLKQRALTTGFYKEVSDVNKGLYAYLTEKAGKKIETFQEISDLYDTLYIETLFNYSLPEWTNGVFPEPLRTLGKYKFSYKASTPESAKYGVGQLFDQILQQFSKFVDKSSSEKFYKFMIYSTHDTNVFNVLSALDTPNLDLIPYGAVIIFELRKDLNGKNYVKMLYKTDNATVLSMGGCESNCAYADFLKIFKPLAISDSEWDNQCQVSVVESITESISNFINKII